MQNDPQGDRLSWGDTVFLNLERETMPLNMASVFTFEGEVSFPDYLRFVETKLPLLPRYLKKIVSPPFNIGLPSWEFDPSFDIHNHVRELTLKRGTESELKALAGRILSKAMDRQHPLWDLTLVHGLKGKRTALIARLHHCLADGIAGVGIMKVLLDASPIAPRLPRRKLRLKIPQARDPLASLMSGVVESYSDFVKRLLSAFTDLLTMAQRVAAQGEAVPAEELSRFLPEITAFTERLRFNVPYRGPQKFCWSSIPLERVKAIRQVCGASVNDVVLALVTATVRRYSELHGDPIKGRLLRLMVPVNLRDSDQTSDLGNRISLVPITIPLDIRNPRRLVAAVHRRTAFIKQAHAAELVSLAGGLIEMLPGPLQSMIGPHLSRLPITPFNLVCTNVPGPQFPLYLLGHKMLTWYPYVPVGGEMAMNCAILSYNGHMYFGFSGDVHAAPDLRRMDAFLKLSFHELCEAVHIDPPKKVRSRTARNEKPKKQAAGKVGSSDSEAIPVSPIALSTSALAEPPIIGAGDSRPRAHDEKVLTQLIA